MGMFPELTPYKPTRFNWVWISLLCLCMSIAVLLWVRHRSLNALSRASISAMEANQPWMVVDPVEGQRVTAPFMDRTDPNILYLVVVGKSGEAIRIDLKTKSVSPYKFNVNDWKEVKTQAIQCPTGLHYDFSGYYCFHQTQRSSLRAEFRGKEETRTVRHMFGYPWANEPGLRRAELRTGVWYIVDERSGQNVELLRVKIMNAELSFFDMGDMQISPDERWIIFWLSNLNGRVFIFDREKAGPVQFTDESTNMNHSKPH